MAFGSRSKIKKCANVGITLNGEKLKMVPSYKYLGIILDQTLNFNQHIATVIQSVQHKILLLGKIKKYLKNEVALKIYKAMVLPYFDYADVIYDKASTSELDKLQRLQNRCLKLCQGNDRYFGTDQVHKDTGVPFLKDRRKAHTLNFMYMRKEKKPDLLNRRKIRTRAHDAPLFDITIPRCEAFKRSVGYHGAASWNNLTPVIRRVEPYLAFKEAQKKEMLAGLAYI